jgi:CheY-like chemotaxis protein
VRRRALTRGSPPLWFAPMPEHAHVALLVEDHADACEAFRLLIETHGYEAVGAQSGREAIGRLRAGLRCCLIVLDWWLPDMRGDEFLRHLRSDPDSADTPVAVLTGDARARAEAIALGVRAAFLKPVDPECLIELLEGHCPKTGPSGSREVA